MADKFLNFLKDAHECIVHIMSGKKEKDNKEVVKWHTELDRVLHDFVGHEGKTKEEKNKGV